ncbi:N-acetyl-gamma-glutamyl-phosphate reductase, partial [Candidatus Hydrogenedentota bacterium]
MIRVGIVGATGYAGREVLRLALSHPECTVTTVTSTTRQGVAVADELPSFAGLTDLRFSEMNPKEMAASCDA